MTDRFSIVKCPSAEQIREAGRVLSQFQLHFYQLLYVNGLTTPDGGAFNVTESRAVVRIEHRKRPEFAMTVTAEQIKQSTVPEIDGRVLAGCVLIQKAIEQNKPKVSPNACCALAELRNCVCYLSTNCVIHGQRCVGSHE